MKLKTYTDSLDSRNYRILFELAKQEGIEALQKLLKDLEDLERKSLGEEAIFDGSHATLSLIRTNRVAISYLREHKSKLKGLNLSNPDIKKVIETLASNPTLLDTYIKNAKILEEYRIGRIDIFDKVFGLKTGISAQIYRDEEGKIIDITKYYTDGEFKYGSPISTSDSFASEMVPTKLNEEVPVTWVLRVDNYESGNPFRAMYLSSFDFNADKLPTEEELQSYELPASLKLHMNK